MAESITVNVNDYVIITLKDKGKQILLDYNKSIGLPEEYYRKPQEDGTYKLPMWEFMKLFGPYLYMGVEVPFETDIIIRKSM